jgi:hypothetical protein
VEERCCDGEAARVEEHRHQDAGEEESGRDHKKETDKTAEENPAWAEEETIKEEDNTLSQEKIDSGGPEMTCGQWVNRLVVLSVSCRANFSANGELEALRAS